MHISKAAVLVVGATGDTGKHVVQQLLERNRPVHVIVRSKEKMLRLIDDTATTEGKMSLLKIHEASFLDMTEEELQAAVDPVSTVVSCLGHNVSIQGLFGHPRRLVTDATQRLTQALIKAEARRPCGGKRKFILMNSDGVARPDGTEPKRVLSERIVLALLRRFLPPHADNEAAAAYLHHSLGTDDESSMSGSSGVEWSAVRPTDLIDAPKPTEYETFDAPQGSLFGSGVVSRANVAKLMVDMIVDESLWSKYKYQFPVVHDKGSVTSNVASKTV